MPKPKLIVTDFDGTVFSEFTTPPVPFVLQNLIQIFQSEGAQWVIATGRDMSSLMEILGRAQLLIEPDWIVLVEREIYHRVNGRFLPLEPWNTKCTETHATLFSKIAHEIPTLAKQIQTNCKATIYSDAYSPLCIIGSDLEQAEIAFQLMQSFASKVPNLTVVRNDVYMRFAHADYNKGTAVQQIISTLKLHPSEVFIAGDHLNDIPMLDLKYARWIAAPANAVPAVKSTVLAQGGYVSPNPYGLGTYEALTRCFTHSPHNM